MHHARSLLTNLTRPRRRLALSIATLAGLTSVYTLPRVFAPAPRTARPQSSMSAPAPPPYQVTPYTPPADLLTRPEQASAFARQDESADSAFYASPRFVTHIDEGAVAALTAYYDGVLPQRGRVLDLCTSWTSHYPARAAAEPELRVYGVGMNAAELARNDLLARGGRVVRDLNAHPALSAADLGLAAGEALDALTCTVSIDYLTRPVEVLRSLRALTRRGGSVHLAVSNRCFPTKAVRRWLYADEETRLRFCCEDLARAGWADVEVVRVTDGAGGAARDDRLGGVMAMMGLGGGDPLWVVRGRNAGGA